MGVAEGEVYVAMELVDGGSLKSWLAAAPRTWREVLAVYLDAGRGLAAAHRAGLVHRDFKAENVLVGTDRRVRVSDFGLSTSFSKPEGVADAAVSDARLTQTGAMLGTPRRRRRRRGACVESGRWGVGRAAERRDWCCTDGRRCGHRSL